jgi:DNA primase
MNVKVTPLPPGEDPDSFSKKKSNEEFKEYIKKNETDFIRFKTELLMKESESDPILKANLVKEIVRSIAVIPEAIPRTIYIQECSNLMNLSEQVLYNEVNRLLRDKAFQDRNRYPSYADLPAPSQKRVESTKPPEGSYSSEREVVRLLLKYGSDEYDRIEHKEEGTEEVVSIAQFIIGQIKSDDLDFSDALLKKIFDDYTFHIKEGIFPGDKFFVMHQDPEISMISADMLSESYIISKIWSLKKAYVATEKDVLREMVPDTVLKFKSDKIQMMIREVNKEMLEAQKNGDSKKVDETIQRYTVLKTMLKEIGKNLGDRIIL